MGASADVIVLGAGMVGVSVALHLQKRGRDVVLACLARPAEPARLCLSPIRIQRLPTLKPGNS